MSDKKKKHTKKTDIKNSDKEILISLPIKHPASSFWNLNAPKLNTAGTPKINEQKNIDKRSSPPNQSTNSKISKRHKLPIDKMPERKKYKTTQTKPSNHQNNKHKCYVSVDVQTEEPNNTKTIVDNRQKPNEGRHNTTHDHETDLEDILNDSRIKNFFDEQRKKCQEKEKIKNAFENVFEELVFNNNQSKNLIMLALQITTAINNKCVCENIKYDHHKLYNILELNANTIHEKIMLLKSWYNEKEKIDKETQVSSDLQKISRSTMTVPQLGHKNIQTFSLLPMEKQATVNNMNPNPWILLNNQTTRLKQPQQPFQRQIIQQHHHQQRWQLQYKQPQQLQYQQPQQLQYQQPQQQRYQQQQSNSGECNNSIYNNQGTCCPFAPHYNRW